MKNKLIIVSICYLFLAQACTKDKKEETVACTLPDSISFKQQVQPLFNQYCNTAGCHSGTTPTGNLNLTDSVAYDQLTRKGKGYIDTLNPSYSLLYAQMVSTTNPMPPTGKLDECKTNLILKWITQKAKRN